MRLTTAGRLLLAAVAYVLAQALLVLAGGERVAPPVAARLLVAAPALAAAAAALSAARRTAAIERLFWALLAGSCAAEALRPTLRVAEDLSFQVAPLASRLIADAPVVLMAAALLVRPHRPRSPADLPTAALDWLMAVVGGYFAVLYFVVLPATRSASLPWPARALPELLPALLALGLALGVPRSPFHRTYRWLAAGLGLRALLALIAQAPASAGGWWGFAAVGFFPVAAAALFARGPVWVHASVDADPGRRPARLAVLAVAAPPLLDLVMRGLGVHPALAEERSTVAVACSSLLTVLAALRVRRRANRRSAIGEATEARRALGEPTASLQFASGVAHELNNPLMAVGGWAELALRRGAPEAPVLALLHATRRAADVVARLQQITRSSNEAR